MLVIMSDRSNLPTLTIATLPKYGGHRCLDFVNTVEGADEAEPSEYLVIPDDLRIWARRADIALDPPLGEALEADALERARSLRQIIYSILCAMVEGRSCSAAETALLTAAMERSAGSRRLVPVPVGIAWKRTRRDLNSLIDMLAVEAVAFLVEAPKLPLRRCVGSHCGWFFLDYSRNKSRRWCSMSYCGNRAKARRFRRRNRPASEVLDY